MSKKVFETSDMSSVRSYDAAGSEISTPNLYKGNTMTWQRVFSNPTDRRYKTRAAFLRRGKWGWVTWTHEEPSKHAAIITKGRELGAQGWDMGNADHYSMADYPAGRGF